MTICTKYFCRPKNKHEVSFKTGLQIAFVCQVRCMYDKLCNRVVKPMKTFFSLLFEKVVDALIFKLQMNGIMSNTPEKKKKQRHGMTTLLKSHGRHLIHS